MGWPGSDGSWTTDRIGNPLHWQSAAVERGGRAAGKFRLRPSRTHAKDRTMKVENELVGLQRTAGSARLFAQAQELIASGVNSTARAPRSGWSPYPLFVESGKGSRIIDVDGNEYIDYLLGLGPMLLGHRPERVTRAVVDFIQHRGTV